jgi:hypothetical protein
MTAVTISNEKSLFGKKSKKGRELIRSISEEASKRSLLTPSGKADESSIVDEDFITGLKPIVSCKPKFDHQSSVTQSNPTFQMKLDDPQPITPSPTKTNTNNKKRAPKSSSSQPTSQYLLNGKAVWMTTIERKKLISKYLLERNHSIKKLEMSPSTFIEEPPKPRSLSTAMNTIVESNQILGISPLTKRQWSPSRGRIIGGSSDKSERISIDKGKDTQSITSSLHPVPYEENLIPRRRKLYEDPKEGSPNRNCKGMAASTSCIPIKCQKDARKPSSKDPGYMYLDSEDECSAASSSLYFVKKIGTPKTPTIVSNNNINSARKEDSLGFSQIMSPSLGFAEWSGGVKLEI